MIEWACKECEAKFKPRGCKERPAQFDDCSSMPLQPVRIEDGTHTTKDIKISLKELLKKVKGYPCMEEARRRWYSWAKQRGKLLSLCQGCWDPCGDFKYPKCRGKQNG